jgi:hypothetical protein
MTIRYQLPSGAAQIEGTEYGTKEMSYPLSRKELEAALMEAMWELAKIKNLEALANSMKS